MGSRLVRGEAGKRLTEESACRVRSLVSVSASSCPATEDPNGFVASVRGKEPEPVGQHVWEP